MSSAGYQKKSNVQSTSSGDAAGRCRDQSAVGGTEGAESRRPKIKVEKTKNEKLKKTKKLEKNKKSENEKTKNERLKKKNPKT